MKGIMEKELMEGSLEKAVEDSISLFRENVRSCLFGMNSETALIFYEKLQKKLDKIDRTFRKMKIDME